MSKQSKIPAAELAIFCQELYQLVQSGLPIADGLNMLLKQSKIPAAELAIFCQELYQLVQSGLPIADGLNMLL